MRTAHFSAEQQKAICLVESKCHVISKAYSDEYTACLHITNDFNSYHAEILIKADLHFTLSARIGYVILSIIKQQ